MFSKKEVWITKGYETFAENGLKGINIENISKSVGKSKSSFYHHFAELDLFIDLLLERHLQQSKFLSEEIGSCKTFDNQMINILLKYKTDILFNKNLRFQNQEKFLRCIEKSTEIIEHNFLKIWSNYFNFKGNLAQTKVFIDLVQENFYLSITAENITSDYLKNYFFQLKNKVEKIQNVL